MKKIGLIIIFIGLLFFVGCIPSPSKMIIGEWKLNRTTVKSVDSIVQKIIKENKSKVNEGLLRIELDNELNKITNKIKIIFKEDRTYVYTDSAYFITKNGIWKISDDYKKLNLKPVNGPEQNLILHEIRGDKLFIEMDRKIGEYFITYQLYFYRP